MDFSEENLTFYLWVKDYRKRFFEKEEQCAADLALAPEWTEAMQEEAMQAAKDAAKAKLANKKTEIETNTTEIFAGTDFGGEKKPTVTGNPFNTPPRTPQRTPYTPRTPHTPADSVSSPPSVNPWDSMGRMSENPSQTTGTTSATYQALADEAFQANGVLPPCKSISLPILLSRFTSFYLNRRSASTY